MTGQEDFFTPEHIDKQVEELLQKRSPNAQVLRFARDLRSLLSSSEEDTHSLERVLSRLLQENEHYSEQKIAAFSEIRAHPKTHHKRIYNMSHPVKAQQFQHRWLSIFAAALTVAVLVGSMLFVLTNLHHHPANTLPSASGSSKVSPTVQVNPTGPIGKIVYHAPPKDALVSTLRWSPDGTRIAAIFITGVMSQRVQSWDAFTGKNIVTYSVPGTEAIETLNWSSDGTLLSIADGQSGRLYLFIARTGALKTILKTPAASPFYQQPTAGPTPTGPLGNQENQGTTFFSSTYSLSGPAPLFRSQAWSHDDRYLAAAYANTSDPVHSVDVVYVWDTVSGALVKTLTDFKGANNLAWSRDDQLLGAAALLPQYPGYGAIPMVLHVEFWNTATWGLVIQHQFFNNVYTFTWSPDARQIALSDGAYPDRGVKIIDAMTGQTLKQFAQRESNITELAWSPNGEQLALNFENSKASVELWNVTNGTLFYSFDKVYAYDVAWSPNSKYIACQEAGISHGEVLVWIAG